MVKDKWVGVARGEGNKSIPFLTIHVFSNWISAQMDLKFTKKMYVNIKNNVRAKRNQCLRKRHTK